MNHFSGFFSKVREIKTPPGISVKGGTLYVDEPYYTLGDNGFITEFKWKAVSSRDGSSFVFHTKDVAEYWLKIRQDHDDWLEFRRNNIAAD